MVRSFALVALAGLACSSQALAQCGAWLPVTQPTPQLAVPIQDLVNFDPDGAGPLAEVVVVCGGVSNTQLSTWNGSTFTNFATAVSGSITDMIVFNGQIVAAGLFTTASGGPVNRIATWNGTTWTPFATGFTGGAVNALAVFNGELYAGGAFTTAGATTVNRVARWNGTAWQAMGTGVGGTVEALTVFNNELIVGGTFTTANGSAAQSLARWDGTTWQAFSPEGLSFPGTVNALSVWNGQLIVGGAFAGQDFQGDATNNLAAWNGSSWSSVGNPFNSSTFDIATYNGSLYVTGSFNSFNAGSLPGLIRIGRFDGSSWQTLGAGIAASSGRALAVFNGELLVGGFQTRANTGIDASGSPEGIAARFFSRWVDVAPTPPVFSDQPISATAPCAGNATFTVNAIGYEDRKFAWRLNGVPLVNGAVVGVGTVAGATTPTLSISALAQTAAGTIDCVMTIACGGQSITSNPATLTMINCCNTIDFNGNGVFPEDQDVVDFFDVLAGAACSTGTCQDIDFNNNGVFPEDQDVVDFFNVLAGGQC